MTEERRERLEKRLREGFRISSTQSLEQGLRLYRAHFRPFALFSLIVPLVGTLLGLLPLGWIGTLVSTLLIAPVLNAGYYLVADQLVGGEKPPFEAFFRGRFQAGPLILNNLLTVLILAIVMMPTYFVLLKAGFFDWYQEAAAHTGPPSDLPEPPTIPSGNSTVMTLNIIPLLYLAVGFVFSFPLILFFQANPLQALELSRRLVTKQWFAVFLLLLTFFSMFFLASFLLGGLMVVSAAVANVVAFGLFLFLPWAYCSIYLAFRQAVDGGEEGRRE